MFLFPSKKKKKPEKTVRFFCSSMSLSYVDWYALCVKINHLKTKKIYW